MFPFFPLFKLFLLWITLSSSFPLSSRDLLSSKALCYYLQCSPCSLQKPPLFSLASFFQKPPLFFFFCFFLPLSSSLLPANISNGLLRKLLQLPDDTPLHNGIRSPYIPLLEPSSTCQISIGSSNAQLIP